MNYILDTNICVLLIRQKSPHVLARLTAQRLSDVGISSITAAELQYGVYKSSHVHQNQQALDQFLLPLTILTFDEAAALSYGQIRAALERQGPPIGSLDTLIAAHALSARLTLVTNNVREFSRVAGLNIEDWTKPL
jgi:tRNA(fMet)-specific endonuclease VapC